MIQLIKPMVKPPTLSRLSLQRPLNPARAAPELELVELSPGDQENAN